MLIKSKGPQLKTILAILWLLFTFSLVTWWWVFFLHRLSPNETLSIYQNDSSYRMIAWEGSILMASILLGGIALVVFTIRDQRRHERLRFFFATFSHDIKTSIARLRLQAEVLEEELTADSHPILSRLMSDIHRLDLQLENSLLLAHIENGTFNIESCSLTKILSHLRNDFPEVTLELEREVQLLADQRALLSVFKNLIQNAILHGKATQIKISPQIPTSGFIQLTVRDNGLGFQGPTEKLGSELLTSQNRNSNGIGLLITTRLIETMGGKISFESKDHQGFSATLSLRGELG